MGSPASWVVVGLDNGATSNYATVLDAAGRFLVDRLVETPSSARPRLSTRLVVAGRCRPSSHDPAGGKALERATGVLMERHGLPADTAAERIRQTATRGASPCRRRRQTPSPATLGRPAPIGTIARVGCAERTLCQPGHGVRADDKDYLAPAADSGVGPDPTAHRLNRLVSRRPSGQPRDEASCRPEGPIASSSPLIAVIEGDGRRRLALHVSVSGLHKPSYQDPPGSRVLLGGSWPSSAQDPRHAVPGNKSLPAGSQPIGRTGGKEAPRARH